jgi:hypothetical protein
LRCANCGSEVDEGARFCSNCGSLMTHPIIPTPSGLLYLFADHFVAREKPLSQSEKVPCGDAKVQRRELAQTMLRAAFASLKKEGRIGLSLGQKKTLIFKSNAIFVTLRRGDAYTAGGLEAGIFGALTGDAGKDTVDEVSGRMISEECPDPWGAVIEKAKDDLLRLGYFTEEGRRGLGKIIIGRAFVPRCDRIVVLQAHIPMVQGLLNGLDDGNHALGRQLGEDIKKGITSRYQTRDIDADE